MATAAVLAVVLALVAFVVDDQFRRQAIGTLDSSLGVDVEARVARSTETIQAARRQLGRGLALALPLGLLAGTLVAFLVAGRTTSPIRRLSLDARAVGSRDPAARLDVASLHGELRDLAETLNQAFDRLASSAERER